MIISNENIYQSLMCVRILIMFFALLISVFMSKNSSLSVWMEFVCGTCERTQCESESESNEKKAANTIHSVIFDQKITIKHCDNKGRK